MKEMENDDKVTFFTLLAFLGLKLGDVILFSWWTILCVPLVAAIIWTFIKLLNGRKDEIE